MVSACQPIYFWYATPYNMCARAFIFVFMNEFVLQVQPGSCQWNNIKFERISANLKYIQDAGSETKIPPSECPGNKDLSLILDLMIFPQFQILYLGCEQQQTARVITRIMDLITLMLLIIRNAFNGSYFRLLIRYNRAK